MTFDAHLPENRSSYFLCNKLTSRHATKNRYLFSQEAVSMSMLWDRDKLWDCVSRLLEGELERELTPSLL